MADNRVKLAEFTKSRPFEGVDITPAPVAPPKEEGSFSLLGGVGSGRTGSFVGSVAQGAGRALASVPEALEIVGTEIYNAATDSNYSADDFYNPVLDGTSGAIKGFFGLVAQENPEYAQEIQSKFGQGLGSIAGGLVSGGLGTASRLGQIAVATGVAGAQLGVEGVEDYKATVAAQGNASDGRKEFQTFAANVPLAALEALSFRGIFKAFDKAAGGKVQSMVSDALFNGTAEAATEALQNIGQNLIARDLIKYDVERDMWQATPEAAGIGGAVGVTVSIMASLLGGRSRGAGAPPKGPLETAVNTTGISPTQDVDGTKAKEAAGTNPVTGQTLATKKVVDLQEAMDKASSQLPNATEEEQEFLKATIANYEAELKTISLESKSAIERQEASDVLNGENRTAVEPEAVVEPEPAVEQQQGDERLKALADENDITLPTITGEGGGIFQLAGEDGTLDTDLSKLWDKINENPTAELLLDFQDTFPKWYAENVTDDSVTITGEEEVVGETPLDLPLEGAVEQPKGVGQVNKAYLASLAVDPITTPVEDAAISPASPVAKTEPVQDLPVEQKPIITDVNVDTSVPTSAEEVAYANQQKVTTTPQPIGEQALEEEPETAPQVEATTEPSTVTEPAVQQTEETVQTDTNSQFPQTLEEITEVPRNAEGGVSMPPVLYERIKEYATVEQAVMAGEPAIVIDTLRAMDADTQAATRRGVEALKEDYQAGYTSELRFERADEFDIAMQELGVEIIQTKAKKPFKNEAAAKRNMKTNGLEESHEAIKYRDGYAIVPLPTSDTSESIDPERTPEYLAKYGSTGTTANPKSTSPITTRKTGTTIQRDFDFETEGTYVVTLTDGQVFHIHRDTNQFSEPTWHVAEIDTVAGYAGTKADTIAQLEKKVKAPTTPTTTETVDNNLPIDFDGEFVIYPNGKSRFEPEPQLTGKVHKSRKTGETVPQKPWKSRGAAQASLNKSDEKFRNIYEVIPYEGGFAIAPNAEMRALVAAKTPATPVTDVNPASFEEQQAELSQIVADQTVNSTVMASNVHERRIVALQNELADAEAEGKDTTLLEKQIQSEQAVLDVRLKVQSDLTARAKRAEAGTTRSMTDAEVDETIAELEAGEDTDLDDVDTLFESDTEVLAYGDTSKNISRGLAPWSKHVEEEELSPATVLPNGRLRYVHTPAVFANIKAMVDKFNTGASKFGGKVVLLKTANELPSKTKRVLIARHMSSTSDDIGASGLFTTDENGDPVIYLIASNIGNQKQALVTLVHETVGHFGFQSMFEAASGEGKSTFSTFLEKEAKRNPKILQEAVNLVFRRGGKGYIHLLSRTNLLGKNIKVMVGNEVRYVSVENAGKIMNEYIAFSTEQLLVDPQFQKKYGGLRKRLLAAARHMFRKMGFLPKDLTTDDIYSLIAESNRRLFDLENKSAVGFLQKGRGMRYLLAKWTDVASPNFSPEAAEMHGVAPEGSLAAEQEAVDLFEADFTPLQREVADQQEAEQVADLNRAIEYTRNGATDLNDRSIFDKWTSTVETWQRKLATMPLVKKLDGLKNIAPLGKIADKNLYRDLGTEARSFIAKGEAITRKADSAFKNMTSTQKTAVKAYFQTKGADINAIAGLSAEHAASLEQSKLFIEDLGQMLVDLGVLQESVYKESQGRYLPKMYYKYIANLGASSGKRISFMGYLKGQKQLSVHESAELGRIVDPEIVVPETIGTISRDIALMMMTNNIVEFSGNENLGWVLGESYKVEMIDIEGNKRLTNVYALEENIARLKEQLADGEKGDLLGYTKEIGHRLQQHINYLTALEKESTELKFREVDDMLIASGVDSETITPEMRNAFLKKEYKRMPKDKAYGALSNKFVMKPIYSDFVETIRDADSFDHTLQKGHQIWKASKVVWNVPVSTVRNSAGNFALLDLATNTNSAVLSKMVFDEIRALVQGDASRWRQYGDETGVIGTTFSSNELNMVKRTLKSDLAAAVALEKVKGSAIHAPMAFGISMGKSALDLSNALSEFYGFQEGIFKAVAMRDYIQQWEAQNNANLEDVGLDPALRKAVLLEAARRANSAIFDYGEAAGFIKWSRKYPFIGSPFITFIYKSALKMPENLAKHPQKFIKYQVVTSVAAMSMLGFYADWSEDEAEEVVKLLADYYDNNGSIMVLPYKDGNGRPQFIDLSIFFPYAPHANVMKGMAAELARGDAAAAGSELLQWSGMLGAPAFSLGTAIKTNKDPFTKRDIVPEGASAVEKLQAIGTYAFAFVMPPVLTERGGIGHMLDNVGIDAGPFSTGRMLNKLGEDKETLTQASMRLLGINAVPADKRLSRINTRGSRDFQLRKLSTRKYKLRKDKNISDEDRASQIRDINTRMKMIRKKYSEKLN